MGKHGSTVAVLASGCSNAGLSAFFSFLFFPSLSIVWHTHAQTRGERQEGLPRFNSEKRPQPQATVEPPSQLLLLRVCPAIWQTEATFKAAAAAVVPLPRWDSRQRVHCEMQVQNAEGQGEKALESEATPALAARTK